MPILPLSRRRARRRGRFGFTLIEILVVIVVIAVLASLVAPNIFKNVGQAKQTTARAQIETISAALKSYRLDVNTYPSSQQGLDALWSLPTVDPPPMWRGPYTEKAIPMDPWGHPFFYQFPGVQNPLGANGFDLVSYGADGLPGGDGENADIVSWQ